MRKREWTEEEDNYIKDNFGNISLAEMARRFNCQIGTVQNRIEALGLELERKKIDRWTKEEENLLREYSEKYITKTIAKKLGRSYLSVQKKAIKLGIKLHSEKDPWKKWMIDYLKDNINKKSIGEIENVLGISYYRILTKCKELNIEYIKEKWTEEEIKILKEYADKCHYTELVKVLPNRSIGAITSKAYELGIQIISQNKKLNDEEIKFIKDNWGILTVSEISRQLKVTLGVIYRYKKTLNLPNIGQKKKWTDKMIERLRKDAKTKNIEWLAHKYKTSKRQISNIASRYNIKLIDSKKIWTDEMNKKLIDLFNLGLNASEISTKMNIKASTIRVKLKENGLKSSDNKNGDKHRWSLDELDILKKLSSEKTLYELSQILNKTEKQIYSKASKLGLEIINDNHHLWTEEESKRLIELHDKYDMHIISEVMDRSEDTIRKKAKELGIKIRYKERTRWTAEEESDLISYKAEFTVEALAHFLKRTEASVLGKLRYMGLEALSSPKNWTEEEIEQLVELSKNYEIDEIAQKMERSYEAITMKLNNLGLKAKSRVWTDEEVKMLSELLTNYSTFEVANMLNRTEHAVIVKAIKLGYDVDTKYRTWTKEEDVKLSDLWGTNSIENIAKKLNRTETAIVNRVYALGLGSHISNNYEGITIQDISDMFSVNRNIILTSWVSLGLKLSYKKISNNSRYSYVTIKDLYEFLENNQNIWDSKLLEQNILGKEPEWLKEKRKRDQISNNECYNLNNLTKQQLINAKKYFLDLKDNNEEKEESKVLVKTKDKGGKK